jgi:hypothetical protein
MKTFSRHTHVYFKHNSTHDKTIDQQILLSHYQKWKQLKPKKKMQTKSSIAHSVKKNAPTILHKTLLLFNFVCKVAQSPNARLVMKASHGKVCTRALWLDTNRLSSSNTYTPLFLKLNAVFNAEIGNFAPSALAGFIHASVTDGLSTGLAFLHNHGQRALTLLTCLTSMQTLTFLVLWTRNCIFRRFALIDTRNVSGILLEQNDTFMSFTQRALLGITWPSQQQETKVVSGKRCYYCTWEAGDASGSSPNRKTYELMETFIRQVSQQTHTDFISLNSTYEDTLQFQPWQLAQNGRCVRDILLNPLFDEQVCQDKALRDRLCVCDASGWVPFLGSPVYSAVVLVQSWTKRCPEYPKQSMFVNWYQLVSGEDENPIAIQLSFALARLVRMMMQYPLHPILSRGTSNFKLIQDNEDVLSGMGEIRALLGSVSTAQG